MSQFRGLPVSNVHFRLIYEVCHFISERKQAGNFLIQNSPTSTCVAIGPHSWNGERIHLQEALFKYYLTHYIILFLSFYLLLNLLFNYGLITQCSVLEEVSLSYIWNTDTVKGPPLICSQQSSGASSEDNKGQNMDEGQWNSKTPSMHMLLNYSILDKNRTAEPGIQPGTSRQ